MSDTSFGFLLLGSVAALGAALAVGTLAALWRYHRTGAFPGQEPGEQVPRRRLIGLWARVGIGTAIGIYGAIVVERSGVLG